ncbi:hypothetical protein KR018_001344, partial [Drosophila ironensis]
MSCPYRRINFVLNVLTAVLEIVASGYLTYLWSTPCFQGQEFTIATALCMFVLPVLGLQSVVFALFRLYCCTVGLDPIAIVFNWVGGIGAVFSSFHLLMVVILYQCQNEFEYMFYIVGVCGLAAGIMHFANGCLCNYHIPSCE